MLRGGVGGGLTEGSCESDADDAGGPRGVCGTVEGEDIDCRLINCTIGLNARKGLMLRAPRPPFALAAGGGRTGGSGDGECVGCWGRGPRGASRGLSKRCGELLPDGDPCIALPLWSIVREILGAEMH